MTTSFRRPQVSVLGSAEPGSRAYEFAGGAGETLARLGITVVSAPQGQEGAVAPTGDEADVHAAARWSE